MCGSFHVVNRITYGSAVQAYLGISFESINFVIWKDLALCRGTDYEIWFPAVGQSDPMHLRSAASICNECKVQTECLNEALDNSDYVGFWGGTNERERKEIRLLLQANPDQEPRNLIQEVRILKRRRGWRGPNRDTGDR